MQRTTRAAKAKETLEIISAGYYNVGNEQVAIAKGIDNSVKNTILYRPHEFAPVMERVAVKLLQLKFRTEISVLNCTVLEGAIKMVGDGEPVGCLNFASAKNPGGGFLGGALAQEESLAVSSALYPTLTSKFEMYEYNRSQHSYLYSDYMIYSPNVIFFRDDNGSLLREPYQLSVVTSPAINAGAIKANKPEEMQLAEKVMLSRMDKVLALFVEHGIQYLLLGAWGCGVFQNDPADIAQYYSSYLAADGKYSGCFRKVLFAVHDRSKTGGNINAFLKTFAQPVV